MEEEEPQYIDDNLQANRTTQLNMNYNQYTPST